MNVELRDDLLRFAYWVFKDEIGEGHEEEIVDRYLSALAAGKVPIQ